MKKWTPALLVCLFFACKDSSKDKIPDELATAEMPRYIRDMYTLTEKHPDSVALRLQLVDALDSLGAYSKAIGQMDSLITKDSLNYGLWYRKALLQENTGDTTAALRSYRYAIRIYPAPDAILGAANLLAEKKDSAALILAGQIAGMRLGRVYDAHANFIAGVYYARKAEKQKAIQAFDACIANDRSYLVAYMEKGFIYYENRDINTASATFKTVTNINATYADAWYWLGKCQEAAGNKTESVTSYQTALKLDPELKEAAEALKRLGVN